MDAKDGEAFFWLADSRFKLGQVDDALSDVRQAIKRRPDDPGAHALYGTLLAQQNRHADAIDAFEVALELGPSAPDAHEWSFKLGVVLADAGGS